MHASRSRLLTGAIAISALTLASGLAIASTSAQRTSTSAVTAASSDYVIDAVHSTIIFRIKHMDASYSYGRFNKIDGVANYDASGGLTGLKINVDVDSVDTANSARDEHLRNPDFFNTKQFPKATFKSTGVKKAGDHTYDVTGEFTLMGVTKTITVALEHTGNGKSMQGADLAGFEGTFTLKRSDFGITKYLPTAIGDDVRLTISLETIKQ